MASTSSQNTIGWEVLYAQIENDLHEKSDVVIALIHWILVFRKNYKCIIQDYDDRNCESLSNKEFTELLPNGWYSDEIYSINYCKNKKNYVLNSTRTSNEMNITFSNVENKVISCCYIDAEVVVNVVKGELNVMIPTFNDLIYKLTSELIEKVDNSNKPSQATMVTKLDFGRQSSINLRESSSDMHLYRISHSTRNTMSIASPMRNIGGNDLDPLGRQGGGSMLFSPSRSDTVLHIAPANRFPRPRFDDYDTMRTSGNPNNDHDRPRNF